MCSLLIAGLQLLAEDLKARGGQSCLLGGGGKYFFPSVSRCSVRMQPGSRMHKQSRQMAESPRQVSPPVYSGGVSKRDKLTEVFFCFFFVSFFLRRLLSQVASQQGLHREINQCVQFEPLEVLEWILLPFSFPVIRLHFNWTAAQFTFGCKSVDYKQKLWCRACLWDVQEESVIVMLCFQHDVKIFWDLSPTDWKFKIFIFCLNYDFKHVFISCLVLCLTFLIWGACINNIQSIAATDWKTELLMSNINISAQV